MGTAVLTGITAILCLGVLKLADSYDIVNIALNTSAGAKGEYAGAGKAVDGNTNPTFLAGTCTHTVVVDDPWWRTDLGQAFLVTGVRLYNRGDCCWARLRNFTVELSQSHSNNSESLTSPSLCKYYFPGIASSAEQFDLICSAPVYARYVQIQIHNDSQQLTLCEVQVWGAKIPRTSCPYYTRIPGRKVSSMVVSVTTQGTLQQCFFACANTLSCNSLNTFSNVTSYTCELLEDIHEILVTEIVNESEWSYYRILF